MDIQIYKLEEHLHTLRSESETFKKVFRESLSDSEKLEADAFYNGNELYKMVHGRKKFFDRSTIKFN